MGVLISIPKPGMACSLASMLMTYAPINVNPEGGGGGSGKGWGFDQSGGPMGRDLD